MVIDGKVNLQLSSPPCPFYFEAEQSHRPIIGINPSCFASPLRKHLDSLPRFAETNAPILQVYDVTKWQLTHPGGPQSLRRCAGKDASQVKIDLSSPPPFGCEGGGDAGEEKRNACTWRVGGFRGLTTSPGSGVALILSLSERQGFKKMHGEDAYKTMATFQIGVLEGAKVETAERYALPLLPELQSRQ